MLSYSLAIYIANFKLWCCLDFTCSSKELYIILYYMLEEETMTAHLKERQPKSLSHLGQRIVQFVL